MRITNRSNYSTTTPLSVLSALGLMKRCSFALIGNTYATFFCVMFAQRFWGLPEYVFDAKYTLFCAITKVKGVLSCLKDKEIRSDLSYIQLFYVCGNALEIIYIFNYCTRS